MIKRRIFLKTSGVAALGSLFLPKGLETAFLKEHHPIGLQLFTLFNIIETSVEDPLKKLPLLATGRRLAS